MITFRKTLCLSLIGALFFNVFVHGTTFAASKNKDAKRNAQLMQQMRKQQAELQAELEADKQVLADKEKALEEANRTANVATNGVKKLKAELAKSSEQLEQKNAEIDQLKLQLAEQKLQIENALADLAANEQQRKTLTQNILSTRTQLTACTEKNQLLFSYGKSLIQIYEKPSLYESVMRSESFFQLKRVELENILQDKLDDIENAKVGAN